MGVFGPLTYRISGDQLNQRESAAIELVILQKQRRRKTIKSLVQNILE